jgi:glucokinase
LHDVKAATLGEATYGSGVGIPYFAYLNIGTGIAVGLLLENAIYRGAAGRAGEIGPVMMQPDGPLCACGRYGCLEALASGTALVRQARESIVLRPHSLLAELAGHPPTIVGVEVIAEAARAGDQCALDIVHVAADYLGQAIAGLANVLDLQRVVIGGGLAQMGEVLFDPLRAAALRHMLEAYRGVVEIVPSRLGVSAGAIGAATAMQLELDRQLEVG